MDEYTAVVGEIGNEQGHVVYSGDDEIEARRVAKAEYAKYRGDGWWLVRNCGQEIDGGGSVS